MVWIKLEITIKNSDHLKTQISALRPLDPDLLNNLRELYTVRLTYNSTAIEGNTLTETETQIFLDKGITIGGKSLQDHLEVINHAEAMDFVRDLANANTPSPNGKSAKSIAWCAKATSALELAAPSTSWPQAPTTATPMPSNSLT